MHLTSSPVDWYAARAAGIVAYLLLSSVVLLGLTMALRWIRVYRTHSPPPPAALRAVPVPVGARARPLHHKRRSRIVLRREGDDVIASLRRSDRMAARELLQSGARLAALERAHVPENIAAGGGALHAIGHRGIMAGEGR